MSAPATSAPRGRKAGRRKQQRLEHKLRERQTGVEERRHQEAQRLACQYVQHLSALPARRLMRECNPGLGMRGRALVWRKKKRGYYIRWSLDLNRARRKVTQRAYRVGQETTEGSRYL